MSKNNYYDSSVVTSLKFGSSQSHIRVTILVLVAFEVASVPDVGEEKNYLYWVGQKKQTNKRINEIREKCLFSWELLVQAVFKDNSWRRVNLGNVLTILLVKKKKKTRCG